MYKTRWILALYGSGMVVPINLREDSQWEPEVGVKVSPAAICRKSMAGAEAGEMVVVAILPENAMVFAAMLERLGVLVDGKEADKNVFLPFWDILTECFEAGRNHKDEHEI